MADNFLIPSTLPVGDAGKKMHAVERTVGVETGVLTPVSALADPTDPNIRAAVTANGLTVDVKASVLPTGSATSAKQDTEITALGALLTELGGKTEPADQQHAIIDSSALPAGAATSAKQDTAQTALDAIKIAVETIDNAIAGNEVQVDILTLPALSAGTNNIGDVDVLTLPALPAGNNNIGDVDIASLPAPLTTVGGGTEATALRVTLANDSTGVLSIDDNGGSLTVDGPLTDAQMRATPVPISGTVTASATEYIVRVDEASSTITYVGYAIPGTATSAASWRIKRLDSTTGLIVLWAAGTASFNQVWDNRASLSYS